ncbi:MAG: 50S ribosomal protein L4 [Saprospiraceae bacterium]|nr:50S ribosomal protein L4 [Saprospiraceae bacterium]
MKLDILNIEGKSTGRSAELSDDVFGVEPNEHAVYLAVKQYHANQRQGTHSSKGRSEVAGSRRKLKKQKGTGTARAGDIKNPIYRGGGRLFGPKPRDYSFKLNKKLKAIAKKSALSSKAADGGIMVVEDFTFDAPKTSEFASVLQKLDLANNKVLFITAERDHTLYLSGRNIPKTKIMEAKDLNTYDVLNAKKIILAESSIEKINHLLTTAE